MPDIWTSNPEHLRSFLAELGATCGTAPRVLTPRDPEWTCTFDSKGWLRDIYIHPYWELYTHPMYLWPLFGALAVGVLAGLLWGRGFWKVRPEP